MSLQHDIDALKLVLAAQPTGGPFAVYNDCVYRAEDGEQETPLIHVCTTGFVEHAGSLSAVDALWFAACSPERIKRLLAALDGYQSTEGGDPTQNIVGIVYNSAFRLANEK